MHSPGRELGFFWNLDWAWHESNPEIDFSGSLESGSRSANPLATVSISWAHRVLYALTELLFPAVPSLSEKGRQLSNHDEEGLESQQLRAKELFAAGRKETPYKF